MPLTAYEYAVNRAFALGWNARRAGAQTSACPYSMSVSKVHRRAWFRGYTEAGLANVLVMELPVGEYPKTLTVDDAERLVR